MFALFLNVCMLMTVYILVDAVAYGGAYFGQGATLFIHIDKLRCSGLEPQLVDCPHDNHTLHCTHANDASVVCQQRKLVFYSGTSLLRTSEIRTPL